MELLAILNVFRGVFIAGKLAPVRKQSAMLSQYLLEFGVINKVPHFSGVVLHINQRLFAGVVIVGAVFVPLASDHSGVVILGSNVGPPVVDTLAFGQRAKAHAQKVFWLLDTRVIADCRQYIESCVDKMCTVGPVGWNASSVLENKRHAHRLVIEHTL